MQKIGVLSRKSITSFSVRILTPDARCPSAACSSPLRPQGHCCYDFCGAVIRVRMMIMMMMVMMMSQVRRMARGLSVDTLTR